jgi:hypothetical protein
MDAAVTVQEESVAGYLVVVALVQNDAIPIIRYNIARQIVVVGESLLDADRVDQVI